MARKNEVTYLKDYQPVQFKIHSVELHFDIFEDFTLVENSMDIELDPEAECVVLDGAAELKIKDVFLDGESLPPKKYFREQEYVKIPSTKRRFNLKVITQIEPKKNFSLNGLYFSGGAYFTQNEPHGFRNITFYGDRPDVLSIFKTKITANKKFRYLLSNGNAIQWGIDEKDDSRHFCIWDDPFPKPCYLFALVVGNFDVLESKFLTKSKRSIQLKIFVDSGMLNQAEHALESLKRSMLWDEEKYGLEYDLDTYMIVAAESFNMGAMENKGLNIFNAKYILGNYQTATDDDLEAIEAVVAHEYFHNWTGNRVTCRDWFQLTLKEGLTVFRDQNFTADHHGAAVKRIKDVILLRQRQFEEDAGPLSHPIRPDSYIEMNNFYTTTVYEKGAEVVRMINTIVGDKTFAAGLKLYLSKFDGKAATVEDFIGCFEILGQKSFTQFMNWYSTPGTPVISIKENKVEKKSLTVSFEQKISNQVLDTLLEIPLRISWVSSKGMLKFHAKLKRAKFSEILNCNESEILFILKDKYVEMDISFENECDLPVISLNRHFSAPVIFEKEFQLQNYQVLAEFDNDDFNKWDACQSVIRHYFLSAIQKNETSFSSDFINILSNFWKKQVCSNNSNNYFNALFLNIPSEDEINELLPIYSFQQVRELSLSLSKGITYELKNFLMENFNLLMNDQEKQWTSKDMGIRKFKNTILDLLLSIGDTFAIDYALNMIKNSSNMNQQYHALYYLNKHNLIQAEEANQVFIDRNKTMSLSVDKWLKAQMCNLTDSNLHAKLQKLVQSPYFDIKVPNKVYALIISWINNLAAFNNVLTPGYSLMSNLVVEIDQFNPQVAARVLKNIKTLKKLPQPLNVLMQKQLEAMYSNDKISKDSSEIIEKFLKG